ncbi:hypothetical protein GCM10027443_43350 [Pontibacter brevis]
MKKTIVFIALSVASCSFGYAQTTNNGIIIQNNIIVNPSPSTLPVYTPEYDHLKDPKTQQMLWNIELDRPKYYPPSGLDDLLSRSADYDAFDNYMKYATAPTYYCKSNLNLRGGGGTDFPIVAQLQKSEKVLVISSDGDWWQVYYPHLNKKGYIKRTLLSALWVP